MKRISLLLLLCALSPRAAAAEDLSVLRHLNSTNPPGRQLEFYLKKEFNAHLDVRLETFEKLKSRADCEKWVSERREFFIRQLGGFPERTPLNAKTVRRLKGKDHRIENILFESRPQHHVTANLYLPDETRFPAPWPAVLIPCGHSHNGKAAGGYQRTAILLARHGMAALCYDPIGQGERYQIIDHEKQSEHFKWVSYKLPVPHPSVKYLCTMEHTMMGLGSILLGSNVAQYRIWDGMRAIDYLQSRPDIRADKIGCAGNSGGGTLTAYLMALDDRIVAAAPTCYLTTFRRLIDSKGAQDAEQNIFGQIAFGMDEGDYLMMRAPRPTLICAGTRDATFDINGTWELYREAKRFYSRMGHPERVDIHEADLRHGMYFPQREAIAGWMHRWLLGTEKRIHEYDPSTLPDPISDKELIDLSKGVWTQEELHCTPEGQVLLMPYEKSVFELNAERARTLATDRASRWNALDAAGRRQLIRKTIGAKAAPDVTPKVKTVSHLRRSDYAIEKLALEIDPDLEIPALLFIPDQPDGSITLHLHGASMTNDAAVGGPIEALIKQGTIVLAAELRGIGETETGHHKRDYGYGQFGRDVQEVFLAYLIGRSYVGMRTDDVLAWAGYLAKRFPKNRVRLTGIGEAAIPTLHAAALQPERFEDVTLRHAIRSWTEIVSETETFNQTTSVVHGSLLHYDLPDLIPLAGANVRMEHPVDALGGPAQ